MLVSLTSTIRKSGWFVIDYHSAHTKKLTRSRLVPISFQFFTMGVYSRYLRSQPDFHMALVRDSHSCLDFVIEGFHWIVHVFCCEDKVELKLNLMSLRSFYLYSITFVFVSDQFFLGTFYVSAKTIISMNV